MLGQKVCLCWEQENNPFMSLSFCVTTAGLFVLQKGIYTEEMTQQNRLVLYLLLRTIKSFVPNATCLVLSDRHLNCTYNLKNKDK